MLNSSGFVFAVIRFYFDFTVCFSIESPSLLYFYIVKYLL